jgi:hypothetical protein
MKIGTMLGVAAAAAAVVAITVVAPARAAAPASDTVSAAIAHDSGRIQPPSDKRWPHAPDPATWLLVLTGLAGLGVMLRASRRAFEP